MGGRGSGARRSRKPPTFYRPDWLTRADQRCAPVREVRDHAARVVQDLGGSDSVSTMTHDLIVRFAFNCYWTRDMEARALAGEVIDPHLYLARVDRLVRIAQTLGLARRAPIEILQEVKDGLREKLLAAAVEATEGDGNPESRSPPSAVFGSSESG